jgi:hypothetical protein
MFFISKVGRGILKLAVLARLGRLLEFGAASMFVYRKNRYASLVGNRAHFGQFPAAPGGRRTPYPIRSDGHDEAATAYQAQSIPVGIVRE